MVELNPRKLMEKRRSPATGKKFLQEIAMNYEEGQIFLAAAELGIFTRLMEPKSAENLAKELGADSRLTARILDVLVSQEVLKKREKLYTTAPVLAPFLMEGSPVAPLNLEYSNEEKSWLKNKNPFEEEKFHSSCKNQHRNPISELN